jgi:bifunctional NMN adenylyltransferase/nudix hydrolase
MPVSTTAFDWVVCIGRFQPLHNGQLALLRHALGQAPRCLVILGSAHAARSQRNPLTWEERARIILQALPIADRGRVDFLPLRDVYDMRRWAAAVRTVVSERSGHTDRIALVGHCKDDTSLYLHEFPNWSLIDPGSQGDLHAKDLRALFFSADTLAQALSRIEAHVPLATLEFLREWGAQPCYESLCAEWRAIAREQAKWAAAPYPPVFVTVDVVLRIDDQVLLIRRGREPGRGCWALPGGFLEQRESVYVSALRELEEETGVKISAAQMAAAFREMRVFDHPDRSQRGRVITHVHYFEFRGRELPRVEGLDDAAEAWWAPLDALAAMEDRFHDDHFHILDSFFGLLRVR